MARVLRTVAARRARAGAGGWIDRSRPGRCRRRHDRFRRQSRHRPRDHEERQRGTEAAGSGAGRQGPAGRVRGRGPRRRRSVRGQAFAA